MNQKIPYAQIAYTHPYQLKKQKSYHKLKLWQVLLFFLVIMVGFIFFTSILYLFIDNSEWISFFSQLGFLASAVVFAKLMGTDLREVFPLKKPRLFAVFGCLVLILAFFMAANVISSWTAYIAPHQLQEISEGMEPTYYSGILSFFILLNWSLVPGICEEAVHRGIILSGIKNSLKNRWGMIILAGAIFGIFHIYPIRWATPALLGAVLAWIVLETDNMFYSCFVHFGYNAFLTILDMVLSSGQSAGEISSSASYMISLYTVGLTMLFYGILVPILLYTGCWMIRRVTAPVRPKFIPDGGEKKFWMQVGIPTVVIAFIGAICMLIG